MLEIELFDLLTECDQMTDIWLNCERYIAILTKHLTVCKQIIKSK